MRVVAAKTGNCYGRRGVGTKVLTEKGDQLMQTGVYAKREVSPDFAEGYDKGLSDAVKREYWSMQEAQRYAR